MTTTSTPPVSPPNPPAPSEPSGGHPGLGQTPAAFYASWTRRVIATLLDSALLGGVTWLALGDGAASPSLWPGIGPDDPDAVSGLTSPWVGAVFVAVIALQAWTGYTPAKLVVGVAVVRENGGGPAGLLRTVGRVVAHVLDAILLIGYLRPLWNAERRTFADSLASTVVVRRRPATLAPGWRVGLTAAATAACLTGVGLTATWQGWLGVPSAEAEAVCADDDGTTVTLRGVETTEGERRLWTTRVTSVHRSYTATWSWTPATAPTGDLDLELTVTAPDGRSTTSIIGIEGRSSNVTTITPWDTGDGRLTAEVTTEGTAAADFGRVVDVSTSLRVDGSAVANCTMDGVTLTEPD